MEKITILIICDHPVVTIGLATLLGGPSDMQVVGETSSQADIIRLISQVRPEVVVIHSYLINVEGETLVADIRSYHPESRVVVINPLVDDSHLRGMLEAGVAGYLLTSEDPEAILGAVRAVAGGEFRVSARLVELLVAPPPSPAAQTELSDRELDVLRLIAMGWDNAAIADELGIAVGTVKNHVVAIYSKLGVHSRVEAVIWALREGLVKIC